jgi:glycosyltransferase involved in cell wall biosynthesis
VLAPKNVGLANLFIGNDKYGYLYKSENANSFKKKINHIINDYKSAFDKAKKAYKSISRFSKKNTHFKLIEEIEKL